MHDDAWNGRSKSGWEVYSAVTGRTGTMVCTWLIDSDQFENAQVLFFLKKKSVSTD